MRLIAANVRVTELVGFSAAPRLPEFVSDISAARKGRRASSPLFNDSTFNRIT